MKYEEYTVWDFIDDDYFVSWAKEGNRQAGQFWEKWLDHNPQKAEDVQMASHIVNNVAYADTHDMTEKEQIDIFENIVKARQKEEQLALSNRKSPFAYYLRYAAVVVMALCLGFTLWYLDGAQTQEEVVATIPMVEKYSPRGIKSTVWLSDGTKVILNADSRLTYPESFANDRRIVELEGEAFFDVQRNEAKPFVVMARGVQTEVLGTSFNIRAFADDAELKVGVVEGKVRVNWNHDNQAVVDHTLLPNQMSVIDLEKRQASKGTFDPAKFTVWKDWHLKFEKAQLTDIFSTIERWYDVDFQVKGKLDLKRNYSGDFDNEPLKAVMEALAHNAQFDYEIKKNTVTVTNSK